MFEDIIKKEPEEKSSLPKCIHAKDQVKCEFFIQHEWRSGCEFYGKLSYSCYLDQFDF